VKIRQTDANEEAQLSEFQQELMPLASVINGDHLLSNFQDKVVKKMNVRQGRKYIQNAVKRFFEAGLAAKRMGVDGEQIVNMRPSLTSRPSSATTHP
jgi:phospholipase C